MCIVSWPERIAAHGEVRGQYVHAVDVVPTIYELLGIEPPEVLKGYQQHPIEGESFAAALDRSGRPGQGDPVLRDARAALDLPRRLAGLHRAPPAGGWGHFEADVWELYDLEHDRAQSKDLAAQEPERLELLKSLWFYNAGLYNGLPLDDRSALEQVLAERPTPAAAAGPVHLLPELRRRARVGRARRIPGRSYTIAAGVKVDSADAQGVLWAAGGVPGGHSLFIKDGRLRYTFNWVGSKHQDVVADTEITAGAHVFIAEFVAAGPSPDPAMPGCAGTLTLYVDDQAVGQRRHRHPARVLLPHRRRHLRRSGQRLPGLQGLRRHVSLHRRHHRQGRRRRLR